jgi:hypothetical protein
MTLTGAIVAAGMMAVLMAGVFSALAPARQMFAVQQEEADVQQRLRIAVETLAADLRGASGVRPYRIGERHADSLDGVYFRTDTIAIVFPRSPSFPLPVDPMADASRTYFIDRTSAVPRLTRYDGREGQFPLLDDVVMIGFEYRGEPLPPSVAAAAAAAARPRVSYGPAPPPVGVDDPSDTWGAGENCTFRVVGGAHAARLATLGGGTAVWLTPGMLTDGPWCPDPAHAERFDADLLRVRTVRVRLRVQAPERFRGRSAALFVRPGAAPAAWSVPDAEVRFDVSPRNVGSGG